METQEEQKTEVVSDSAQAVTTLSQTPVERNPQNGECVGHCGHVSEGQPVWYLCENMTYANPATNVSGKIDWLCICTECEAKLKEDPKANVLAGVGLLEREPKMHLKPIPELLATPEAQA